MNSIADHSAIQPTKILFFSPTGGCRAVAHSLHAQYPQAACIDLTEPSKRAHAIEWKADDVGFFIFPVYNLAIAHDCAVFLQRNQANGTRAVLICVYEGVGTGNALFRTAGLLRSRGFIVLGGALITAPHSYDRTLGGTHWNAARLHKLIAALGNLSTAESAAISPYRKDCQKLMRRLTGSIRIDRTVCTGCGACGNGCPCNAIDMTTLRIKNGRCILCGACIEACPSHARFVRFNTLIPQMVIRRCSRAPKADRYFRFTV